MLLGPQGVARSGTGHVCRSLKAHAPLIGLVGTAECGPYELSAEVEVDSAFLAMLMYAWTCSAPPEVQPRRVRNCGPSGSVRNCGPYECSGTLQAFLAMLT